jgi:hypothetical protein
MNDDRIRRLEIAKVCLNQLYPDAGQATVLGMARAQIDAVIASLTMRKEEKEADMATTEAAVDAASVIQPISPNEAAKALVKFCEAFPPEILKWYNDKITQNYDPDTGRADFDIKDYGATWDVTWKKRAVLGAAYRQKGWKVELFTDNTCRFTKRDEKRDTEIN